MLHCLHQQTLYTLQVLSLPRQGLLQIGKEIVSYESKLEDRFYNVTRGAEGTQAQAHPAGQYLRTIPNTVVVLPVGTTSFTSESSVSMTDAKCVEVKSQIEIESDTLSTISVSAEIEVGISIDLVDWTVRLLQKNH